MTVAIGANEDLRGCAVANNQTQSRPHPELANGVAWMPVSLQPQTSPAPAPGGLLLPSLALLGSGLVLGCLLASGINDMRARNAETRATQASQALQANQRAIDTFCKGVAK
jgi:hypothetical protein